MSIWSTVSLLAGGLGLFLLGMTMMTDGLRQLAGPGLERVLVASTRTRWHALASGVLVTSVVQSSSAVTVAIIGFVNAGLLGLTPALWVLFGANIGTTMTGWIVALVGLSLKIETLALPMIGSGVFLGLGGSGQRRGAAGNTLAGFGLLFFGIGLLQQSFTGLATTISLPQGDGTLTVLAQVLTGMLVTMLIQSSSASIALALTAVQGGLLSMQAAAAFVIGANVGTTITAVLAAIGATPNARRVALAHVVFNVLTACVALLMLPWLLVIIETLRRWLYLPDEPSAGLALFHSVFNVLGVLLMWPLANRLARWLSGLFRAREEDEGQLHYLDRTILQVPSLAVGALEREVARVGHLALRMARAVLTGASVSMVRTEQAVLSQLGVAVQAFVEQMNRGELSQQVSDRLAGVLRVLRYHESVAEQVALAAALVPKTGAVAALDAPHQAFARQTLALLALCDPLDDQDIWVTPVVGAAEVGIAEDAMEESYHALKAALLAAGAAGALHLAEMDEALRHYSALRRAGQQAAKAALRRSPDAVSAVS